VTHAARNGFLYTFERTNGQTLLAKPYMEEITWTKGIDQKTGLPVRSDEGYPGLFRPAKSDFDGPHQADLPVARGRQQLLVGVVQPENQAPLHSIAADVQ
jgi:glucose dehydrogenase